MGGIDELGIVSQHEACLKRGGVLILGVHAVDGSDEFVRAKSFLSRMLSRSMSAREPSAHHALNRCCATENRMLVAQRAVGRSCYHASERA